LAARPLNREVYKTCKKQNVSKADIHNGTNADIHNGTKANIYAKTSEKQTFILTVGVGGGGAEKVHTMLAHIWTCLVLDIRYCNLLQTFSNFHHNLHMR